MDKFLCCKIGQEYVNFIGLDVVYMGVELEVIYCFVKFFELKGMFFLGDWKWKDDIYFIMYDEVNNFIGIYDVYLKDVYVGNFVQFIFVLSVFWELFKGFKILVDYNFFGKNYVDFDFQNWVNEVDVGIDFWKLLDYGMIDLGMNYCFNIIKDICVIVYSNVYNLINMEYIVDVKDGMNYDWKIVLVYYGFGIIWFVGFKVIF